MCLSPISHRYAVTDMEQMLLLLAPMLQEYPFLWMLSDTQIWIAVAESGFWQNVIYEDLSLYCNHCQKQGHEESKCQILHPNTTVKVKDVQNVKIQQHQMKMQYVIKQRSPDTTEIPPTSSLRLEEKTDIPIADVLFIGSTSSEVQNERQKGATESAAIAAKIFQFAADEQKSPKLQP